jgi:hypothetical protein
MAGRLARRGRKCRKYGPGEARGTILIVHDVQFPLPLHPDYLQRIIRHAVTVCAPFRELWVVNEYGDAAEWVF